MKQGIARFFKYARARHQIYLDRVAGKPRPWTKDPILDTYRFTNVFRELDKTTVWFAENVRTPLRDKPEVLLATVAFRLLNRIETGKAIFMDDDLLDNSSAFYDLVRTGSTSSMKKAIKARCGRGPYVTGGYIISSPKGYSKLDGMLKVIGDFAKSSRWQHYAEQGIAGYGGGGFETLEGMHEWLKFQPYLGPFHSYEIVTDLRFTKLLEDSPDINTWANPGPGCKRGLNRVFGRDLREKIPLEQRMNEMRLLLKHAHYVGEHQLEVWPEHWPKWEMREVEHTLCEFDKYERVRLGEGKPRGVYR